MSLLSFIKDAGQKLFNKPAAAPETPAAASSSPASPAAAPASPEQVADLNRKAGEAIKTYVAQQGLDIQDLNVTFDGASGTVVITGRAPSQEASEKAALCCGNVQHVQHVENRLTVEQGAPAGAAATQAMGASAAPAQFHDVAKGDTLSAIAKRYYGDANKYPVIFEANKPMLSHPDKIYPGQKLRIPPLG